MRILSLFIIAAAAGFMIAGCSSSKVYKYPYKEVGDAVKERFFISEWTPNSTRDASMTKDNNEFEITYYDWKFPDTKIMCCISVEKDSKDKTEVYVFVRNWDSWFSPFTYSPTYAKGVLKLLDERLKTGRWGNMPWEVENIERIGNKKGGGKVVN